MSASTLISLAPDGRRPTGTLLTRREVAARIGRTTVHVGNQVRAGRLSPIAIRKKDRAQLFRLADVRAFMREGGD